MRTDRIDDKWSQEIRREPNGAPPFAFELTFVLGSLAAGVLLYGPLGIADAIVDWLAR